MGISHRDAENLVQAAADAYAAVARDLWEAEAGFADLQRIIDTDREREKRPNDGATGTATPSMPTCRSGTARSAPTRQHTT